MGGNIPGGSFLGGNFPGRGGGIFQGVVWWVGIFPGRIFLEPNFIALNKKETHMVLQKIPEE